jgi:bifunctional non-homologous end joining protein LigD
VSHRTLAQIARGEASRGPAARASSRISRSTGRPIAIRFIKPMLARLVKDAPVGEWQYELKFDGYRALAFRRGDRVALLSRNNQPLTARFPGIVEAIRGLDVRDAVIDGEVVALDRRGRSSFQLLQAQELGDPPVPLIYYVFDLLELNGRSLLSKPIEERRSLLESMVPAKDDALIRFSASLGGDASILLKQVRKHGLEGLVGKRAGSVYEPGRRSGAWVKLKTGHEQEFVIGGFTEPAGTRRHFGALLVGYFESRKLRYAGKVGTGFGGAELARLARHFGKIGRVRCPFADLPETGTGRHGQRITRTAMKRCHWLKPELVARIKFAEWTRDGRLRHPVYVGLREDIRADKVGREEPA